MKKILSMILCVALVMSLAVAAFAGENAVATLGNNTYAHPGDDSSVYLTFTAEEAGTYTITNNTQADRAYLYAGDSYTTGRGGVISGIELEAGQALEIELWNDGGVEITFDFDIVLTGAAGGDEEEKVVNDEPQIGDNYMLIPADSNGEIEVTFVAEEAGIYTFDADDNDDSYLKFADSGYEKGAIVKQLAAGEEITFKIYHSGDRGADGYCSFTIEKAENDEPTNEEPVLGSNNIPVIDSYSRTVTFVAENAGYYKFTNDHEEGNDSYIYSNSFPSYYLDAGQYVIVVLEANEEVSLKLYPGDADLSVKFTIEELNPDEVEPDGSELFPFALEMGELSLSLDSNTTFYYTYTATEDGVLTLSGDLGDGELECEGVIASEEGVWVRNVLANETVTVVLSSGYWDPANIELEVSFEAGELKANGTESYPFEMTEGDLVQYIGNGYEYYYTFTSTEDGILTLSGELGDVEVDLDSVVVDANGNLTRNIRANEPVTVIFAVGYWDDSTELVLEVSFEAGELEANGSESFPYELPMGEFNVSFIGNPSIVTFYTYTATENGYLFIDTGLTGSDLSNLYLSGMKKNSETGVASVYLDAGTTFLVKMYSYGTYDATFTASFEPGELERTGEKSAPFILEEGEWKVTMQAGYDFSYDGFYYVFTADKDGVLNITWHEGMNVTLYDDSLNGDSGHAALENVSIQNMRIEMSAGDVYLFNIFQGDSQAVDFTTTVTFETEGEDPVDPPVDPEDPVDPPVDPEDPEDPVDPPVDPEDPIDPTGDNTLVFFALVVLSMTGLVVLVSKKRAF